MGVKHLLKCIAPAKLATRLGLAVEIGNLINVFVTLAPPMGWSLVLDQGVSRILQGAKWTLEPRIDHALISFVQDP